MHTVRRWYRALVLTRTLLWQEIGQGMRSYGVKLKSSHITTRTFCTAVGKCIAQNPNYVISSDTEKWEGPGFDVFNFCFFLVRLLFASKPSTLCQVLHPPLAESKQSMGALLFKKKQSNKTS